MRAKATLLGHPIHQMLVVLPLGLWTTAVIFDVITVFRPSPALQVAAYWNIVAGSVGALLAAPFGLIDWTKIPRGTRAKRVGVIHAIAAVGVLILFVIAAALRHGNPDYAVSTGILVLELVAFALGGLVGWLGGELVVRLGIGVHDDAGPNARSSLRRSTRVPSPRAATAGSDATVGAAR